MKNAIDDIYFFDDKWWACIDGQLTGNDGAGFDSQVEAAEYLMKKMEGEK